MSLSCQVSLASSHVEISSPKPFPDSISFVLWIKLRTTSVCIFSPCSSRCVATSYSLCSTRRIAEGGLWKENKLWNCNLQPRKTTDRVSSLLALAPLPVRHQPAATLLLPNLQLKECCPPPRSDSCISAWLPYFHTLSHFFKHPFVFSSHPLPLPSMDTAASCECSAVKEDL